MIDFTALLLLAVIVEGIVTYAKTLIVDKRIQWQIVTALVLGVSVSLAYRLDFLAMFGLESNVRFFGSVLTGVILSRGSNYLYDLVKLVGNITAKAKADTPDK